MRNKYNAKRQLYKGIRFDSKKELNRYLILEQMQMKNYISELEIHPVYPLLVNGIKIGRYTADFKYKNKDGEETFKSPAWGLTVTKNSSQFFKLPIEAGEAECLAVLLEGYIKESLIAKSEAYKQDQPQKTYKKPAPKASVVEDDDDDVPF